MHLSPHITIAEFEASETAERKCIDNHLPPQFFPAAESLCKNVLEKVRAHYAKPIIITSGYRSQELNAAIGSHPASQHTRGQAADFHIFGHTPLEVAQWIATSDIEYDQLIYEGKWVHVSHKEGRNRRECKTAFFSKDGVHYEHGIMSTGG